ncbi:MAG TPA: hypothetical protein VKX28_25445 [Xanthobacteraceae bacterium]|nr:hypothetical protein [Xanthobacteraceae bacterium]
MCNLVVTSMPRDNPGSLSPTQYADVLAYLLAADCYPAGRKQFPTTATPDIKGAELHPLVGARGQDKTSGTCSLAASYRGGGAQPQCQASHIAISLVRPSEQAVLNP